MVLALSFVLLLLGKALGAEGFLPTGSMGIARYGHTATLLPDGRVLVVGGFTRITNITSSIGWDPSKNAPTTIFQTNTVLSSVASAELYDPIQGNWKSAAPMQQPRNDHTATLLNHGRVLVVGGTPDPRTDPFRGLPLPSTSCEIYDPVLDSWSPTGALKEGRSLHAATRMPDGKVLVVGGDDAGAWIPVPACELYDPVSGTWSDAGELHQGSGSYGTVGMAALVLPSGGVLVAGGYSVRGGLFSGYNGSNAAQLFDPVVRKWKYTELMHNFYFGSPFLVLLPDGTVLAGPGTDFTLPGELGLGNVERYDPVAGTWTAAGRQMSHPPANSEWSHPPAVDLDNGRVLVAGGGGLLPGFAESTAASDLFDPAMGTWTAASPLGRPRNGNTLTRLRDGRVLAAGGKDDASAELFVPVLALGLRVEWSGHHPVVCIQGTLGDRLVLESKGDLGESVWETGAMRTPATPVETVIQPNVDRRFCRVRSLP